VGCFCSLFIVYCVLKDEMTMLCGLQYHELAAEAFYLMSIVYHKLGQLEEREEAAASFQKHIMALENPQGEEDPLYNML
jgi:anaphase-promoting complex subunit 5